MTDKIMTSELKESPGWPPERRARQAELMRRRKPWLRSTGPRTAAGKAKSSGNAIRHGMRSREYCRFRQLLAEHRRNLRALVAAAEIKSLARRAGFSEAAKHRPSLRYLARSHWRRRWKITALSPLKSPAKDPSLISHRIGGSSHEGGP